jgi:hypothetical protein
VREGRQGHPRDRRAVQVDRAEDRVVQKGEHQGALTLRAPVHSQ